MTSIADGDDRAQHDAIATTHCRASTDGGHNSSARTCRNLTHQQGVPVKRAILTVALIVLSAAAQASDFKVASTDVAAGKPAGMDYVFSGFGCTGKNQS